MKKKTRFNVTPPPSSVLKKSKPLLSREWYNPALSWAFIDFWTARSRSSCWIWFFVTSKSLDTASTVTINTLKSTTALIHMLAEHSNRGMFIYVSEYLLSFTFIKNDKRLVLYLFWVLLFINIIPCAFELFN